jgi:hypothetical protein
MSLFQPSTLTFGSAKTRIAKKASKQNYSEFLDRAGSALQDSFKFYNKYNWRWLMTSTTALTVAADTTDYSLPFDFKDVYGFRITTDGRERTLKGIPRSVYDRVHQVQSGNPGETIGYDLYRSGTYGQITVQPSPDAASSTKLLYYRRMWVPCTITGVSVLCTGGLDTNVGSASALGGFSGITQGSPAVTTNVGWTVAATYATALMSGPLSITLSGATFTASANGTATFNFGGDNWYLDLPEDYENALLSRATHQFLSDLGAPEGRLSYWIQMANSEFDEAMEANHRYEDQDISFELGDLAQRRP